MCAGVIFHFQDQEYKTFFPNPKAHLPVLRKNGEAELLPWGRRLDQAGNLPLGGWARHESIKKGRWNKYFPKSVKLSVSQFMEKDFEGKSHWFSLTHGQMIQGLLAHYDDERRLYVVTVQPEHDSAVHDRWPRIISTPR